ncbi:MAG: SMI1/KNR4 family protein [Fluviicola sp.]
MTVNNYNLDKIELEHGIVLPTTYKKFYARCKKAIPKKLIGTDLLHEYPDLNKWACELLEENQLDNFLKKDDFVFMMHQGYLFWYFKANGTDNPMVYGFNEVDKIPKQISPLSDFLSQYL